MSTPVTPSVTIRPLEPRRLDDTLAFFDGDAFSDNPAWASCYCYFYHFGGTEQEWEARTGEENRRDKAALIAAGQAHGYLAYVGERIVGWCHAAPFVSLRSFDQFDPALVPDREQVGSIVCFVVAPAARGLGVARALLDAACAGFARQGLAHAEAYPVRVTGSDARAFHGPLSMYLDAGFEIYREGPDGLVVRKALAG